MSKAMALLSLLFLSLVVSEGAAAAAPSSVSVQVSVELYESNGTVAATVTVANTDSVAFTASVSDAYGNRRQFVDVQPGGSVVASMYTGQVAVAGYTVQVQLKTADGRSSARGYGGSALQVPPAAAVPAVQSPVRYCEGPNYHFGACIAQRAGLPV